MQKILKILNQNLKDPLFKNSYLLIANYALIAILGFFFFILIGKYYSPRDVGLAGAIISASNLLITLSLMGLGSGIIRFLPKEVNKQDMINSCLTITFVFSLLIAGVYILGINIWSPALTFLSKSIDSLLIFFIFISMSALVNLQRSIFIALRSSQFSLFQNIIFNFLKITLVFTLIKFGAKGIISSYALAAGVTFFSGILVFLPKIIKYVRPKPMIDTGILRRMLNISLGNYVAENIASIPNMLLPLMIIEILSSESNAYFFMASNISNLLFMVPVSICSCLFAEGSFSRNIFRNNSIKAIKLMTISLLAIITSVFIFGNELLLLFGEEYAENGYYALCILILSLIPSSVIILYTTIRNVRLEIKPIIYLDIFVASFQITLCYLLMIQMGLVGVTLGILFSQTLGAIIVIGSAIREGWIVNVFPH